MHDETTVTPDSTAVRVALWRAMHAQVDAAPHVLHDELGLELAAPEPGWQDRSDMHPERTRRMRAAIVARARFVEDLVAEQARQGVPQYVLLGAGLDTFAQRRPELAAGLRVFEIDRPGPLEWKRRRLVELGYGLPPFLRLVPNDFEGGESWYDQLVGAGFDPAEPAVVSSTGVAMYLSREAIAETLRQVARMAPGTTLVMTFLVPLDYLEPEDRPALEWAQKGAAASGTPFATLLAPEEMLALAREAGFRTVRHVSGTSHAERYFAERTDGLRPSSGEDMLLATV